MRKHNFRVLGLMSGTSLDGLDMCLAEFNKADDQWRFSIKKSETHPYNSIWQQKLKTAHLLNTQELKLLSAEYGSLLARWTLDFLKGEKVDLISSHGHTVLHQPEKKLTLQIGNGPKLHQKTGVPVVCNFRVQDVLLGGQGAPLVPMGDKLLFADFTACLNLGGFANISFEENGQRLAFDVCPVNIVLNSLSQTLGYDYDRGGELARLGVVNEFILKQLNALPYYAAAAPKSLGREWVDAEVFPLLQNDTPQNLLATFTAHAAQQLADAIKKLPHGKVLVTGGGAYNTFLVEMLSARTEQNIIIPAPEVVEQKEALIFAFLGLLRWLGLPNTLASVTGASQDHSAGVVY